MGMATDVFNEDGQPVVGGKGELVYETLSIVPIGFGTTTTAPVP